MKKIVISGSLAFDYIMDFPGVFTDHINPQVTHKINVSFLINKLKKAQGGTAGNIAYNLALLNTPSSIIGAVGEDFTEYRAFLEKHGVDVTNIKVISNEFCSLGYVMTDKKDDQIWAFYPGAMEYNHTLKIANVKPRPELAMISPCGIKAIPSFVKECKALQIPYLFDPSQQIPVLSDQDILEGIKGAKVFIENDYEHEMIKKRLKLTDEDILQLCEIIIITKGGEGSIIKTNKETFEIKTVQPKEVLDPTGAGDAYRAGFIAGLLRDFDIKTCGQMGATAATYAIEQYGTQIHTFTIEEFKKRYVQAFNEVLEW